MRAGPTGSGNVSEVGPSVCRMVTSKQTIADLLAQLEPLDVRARAMFGEYALYLGEKVVALKADDAIAKSQRDDDVAAGLQEVLGTVRDDARIELLQRAPRRIAWIREGWRPRCPSAPRRCRPGPRRRRVRVS